MKIGKITISKKLSVAIGGCLTVIGFGMTGDISWQQAINSVVGIVLVYLGGQSIVDSRKNGENKPTENAG